MNCASRIADTERPTVTSSAERANLLMILMPISPERWNGHASGTRSTPSTTWWNTTAYLPMNQSLSTTLPPQQEPVLCHYPLTTASGTATVCTVVRIYLPGQIPATVVELRPFSRYYTNRTTSTQPLCDDDNTIKGTIRTTYQPMCKSR